MSDFVWGAIGTILLLFIFTHLYALNELFEALLTWRPPK